MLESSLINYKQVKLVNEIIQDNTVNDDGPNDSLMKYKLSVALTKIQKMFTANNKTVNITGPSFDYKVFQFLSQAKTDLEDSNLDTDTYTIDIANTDVKYVVKNIDTGYISIGKSSGTVFIKTTRTLRSSSQEPSK